jgi:hypothetical protein
MKDEMPEDPILMAERAFRYFAERYGDDELDLRQAAGATIDWIGDAEAVVASMVLYVGFLMDGMARRLDELKAQP